MTDRIAKSHKQPMIQARMVQNTNRMETGCAREQSIFTKSAPAFHEAGRRRGRSIESGMTEPIMRMEAKTRGHVRARRDRHTMRRTDHPQRQRTERSRLIEIRIAIQVY